MGNMTKPLVRYVINPTSNGFEYGMWLAGPTYDDEMQVEYRDGFESEESAEDAVWQKADEMFGEDGWQEDYQGGMDW